jgi:nucleoid-associated protein YgaU
LEQQLKMLNLQTADHTRVHVVQSGETLPYIAYVAYKNPGQWRIIAEANNLRDVRRLKPGTVLQLPPVRD